MAIKKYQDQKEEQIKRAKDGLEIIKEIKQIEEKVPILDHENITDFSNTEKELSMILEDPEEAARKKAMTIASMASQIKEVGLDPNDPVVSNWAEQELGIQGQDFQNLLNQNNTKEEVEKEVLELMEVPNHVVDQVSESIKKR